MATLGELLRDAREAKGISLADAERETKIRQKYIAAIEEDQLSALPGPVFARGFLRNYAAFLGFDPNEILDLYDQQSQPARNRIRAARGEPVQPNGREKVNIQPLSPEPIEGRVRYASSYIAISLLALPIIILFYFVYSTYAGRSQEVPIPTVNPNPPTVTPMSIPSVVLDTSMSGDFNTPTVYVPVTPGGPADVPTIEAQVTITTTPGAESTQQAGVGGSVTVQVTTIRDAWMRVLVDGVQKYSGTLAKGQTREWTGANTVRIRTGRADSVQVTVNGKELGLLGDKDHLIVEKEWNRSGKERVIQR